jgi:hypothetical protein
MQYVDSSVIGVIEVDSSSPIDFGSFAGPTRETNVSATVNDPCLRRVSLDRTFGQPQSDDPFTPRDATGDGPPVIAFRLWREDAAGASIVHADLPRLEAELDAELQRLRGRIAQRLREQD